MRVFYHKDLYSREALLKAAYHFTDRAYVYLGVEGDAYFVDFTPKEGIAFDRESLENTFKNELLAQVIHQTISRQTAPLRELLVARALSSTMVDTADDTAQPEQLMTPADQDQLDAITKDWFDHEA